MTRTNTLLSSACSDSADLDYGTRVGCSWMIHPHQRPNTGDWRCFGPDSYLHRDHVVALVKVSPVDRLVSRVDASNVFVRQTTPKVPSHSKDTKSV